MKIGILTYWITRENYGQILQLYALYTFLKKNGHEPFVINYNGYGDSSLHRPTFYRLLGVLKKPTKLFSFFRIRIKEKKISRKNDQHDLGFSLFLKEKFVFSELFRSFDDLKKNPPVADVYICGSDMIWVEGPRYPAFFLDFGKTEVKKIAYAPSFGSGNISGEYKAKIKPLLENFSFISVREKSGVNICKDIGFPESKWVADPTALLSINDYALLFDQNQNKSKHLFLYLLGHQTDVPFEDIYSFAKEQKCKVIYNAIQGRFDDYDKSYLSIGQWLEQLATAEYVVTNSFHGCMFSIIFKKKFMYLPLIKKSQSINERVFSLLERLKISSRIWNGNFIKIQNEIDYETILTEFNDWINESKMLLLNALKGN